MDGSALVDVGDHGCGCHGSVVGLLGDELEQVGVLELDHRQHVVCFLLDPLVLGLQHAEPEQQVLLLEFGLNWLEFQTKEFNALILDVLDQSELVAGGQVQV